MDILKTKRANALCDVVCVGVTIKKGQNVRVSMCYDEQWPHGGVRTIIGSNLGYTNPEAYESAFSKPLLDLH